MQVHSYLASAPRGGGINAALFYSVRGKDACGWLVHECPAGTAAAYFLLRHQYAPLDTVFLRSVSDDAYGRWVERTAPVSADVRCPLTPTECAELSRLRAEFVREWLFAAADPDEDAECAAYRNLDLPVRHLNVRASQFRRFDCKRPLWVHASPGIDLDVVLNLKKQLPLDRRQLQHLP